MFTGIVEHLGKVAEVRPRDGGLELRVELGPLASAVRRGDSIAVCGACLTLESLDRGKGGFFLSPETLEKTWFRNLVTGTNVNLEHALKIGDPIGGHLVQGHVDAKGRVVSRTREGEGERMEIEVPPEMARFLLSKGSITVDGVSLTIVNPRESRFSVALIPVTLEKTNLSAKKPGDPVNLEADYMGKWVEQMLKHR